MGSVCTVGINNYVDSVVDTLTKNLSCLTDCNDVVIAVQCTDLEEP